MEDNGILGWIIYLVIGGIVGWLASMVMRRDASMGLLLNVVVGVIGALIGGWVGGMLGVGRAGDLTSIPGFLMAIVGAVVLLAIVNMVQRGRVR